MNLQLQAIKHHLQNQLPGKVTLFLFNLLLIDGIKVRWDDDVTGLRYEIEFRYDACEWRSQYELNDFAYPAFLMAEGLLKARRRKIEEYSTRRVVVEKCHRAGLSQKAQECISCLW
jgi:hypothetical protein